MSRHKLIVALVIVAVTLGGWATLHDNGKDEQPALPAAGGFIATTGDPDDPAATQVGGAATSTSAAGLVEKPGDGPGGGTMVDLQGRFRSSMTAVAADSDSVVIECAPDTAPGGGR